MHGTYVEHAQRAHIVCRESEHGAHGVSVHRACTEHAESTYVVCKESVQEHMQENAECAQIVRGYHKQSMQRDGA